MPDVHQGKGIVIGFTCPVTSFVNPQHVGLDIGCGIDLELFDRPLEKKDYALFEYRLKKEIPSGFNINKQRQFEMKPFLKYLRQELSSARQSSGGLVNHLELTGERELEDWIRSVGMDKGMFYKSIGSIGGRVEGYIRTTHNYVDFRDMMLRKGAIRSYSGELMVIPFNMRDGIVVCEGKSNPEWNFSAPHGSGRRMSRAEARRSISMAE